MDSKIKLIALSVSLLASTGSVAALGGLRVNSGLGEPFSATVTVTGKEAKELLEIVGLAERMKHKPNQLSGGEKQRVAIARALVNNPSVIIADEPTGNLDPQTAWDIMALFKEINRRGTTVVMATHAEDIVNNMNERVIEIEKGKIIRDDEKGGYRSEI